MFWAPTTEGSVSPLDDLAAMIVRRAGDKDVRIAQVAPVYESVPPRLYGGTERVVSYLTEELVQQGHDVTLFASGDSVTEARLVPVCPRSLRLDDRCIDQLAHHILMLEKVLQRAESFDLIHFHVDYIHFPFSRRNEVRHLTTLHGRLDIPDLVPLYQEFDEMPLVSISNAQRKPIPWVNWVGNVHHGLPKDLYTFQERPSDYLAFLGRISPEKRVDRAIEIARLTGRRLKIAAKVDAVDREYFNDLVRPLLWDPAVEFIGEIAEKEKNDFLGNAYAYLFPIDWPEPFGLTMIEALACGTPVIAYCHGSVPEVMVDGVTGFVVRSQQEAVKAVEDIPKISRKKCRQVFEERFDARRMARDYLNVYKQLLEAEAETALAS